MFSFIVTYPNFCVITFYLLSSDFVFVEPILIGTISGNDGVPEDGGLTSIERFCLWSVIKGLLTGAGAAWDDGGVLITGADDGSGLYGACVTGSGASEDPVSTLVSVPKFKKGLLVKIAMLEELFSCTNIFGFSLSLP